MKEEIKNIILYSIAILFFVVVALTISSYLKQGLYFAVFWVCYTYMVLVAVGIIAKKPNLILSQIIIMLIPNLIWVIDFMIILITGNSPLGFAKYFFTGEGALLSNILSLHHIYSVPLGIFALSLMKIKKSHKAILISFVEIIFFFILGLFVIPAKHGINCLPTARICSSLTFPEFIPYPLIWLTVVFSFTIISYFIIISLPFIKKIFYKD